MRKIELKPGIFLIKEFLTKRECNDFIEKGESASFETAKVNFRGQQVEMSSVRNNERFIFMDDRLANLIWEKVKSYVPKDFGLYESLGLNEMFRLYKYSEGQRFKMHRDGSYHRNSRECSFYSFLIYLNEDFKGGETLFENGIEIVPKTGDALIFLHPLRHEGSILLEGIKYVLRTDVMYGLR